MPALDTLQSEYAALKAEGERLAGDIADIPRRAAILHRLYRESGGNHVFPLIAAHGALWASSFFEVGGSLGRLIGRRYFYNSRERAFRLGLLDRFAGDFRAVNRQVCIDTYANFRFTQRLGREPAADRVVPPELLTALNRIHEAAATGAVLDEAAREEAFRTSFTWEQELTVAPGVRDAIAKFDCWFMKTLCLRPLVRFAYFPRWRYIWFRNFGDTEERIRKGLKAFRHASRRGWAGVEASLRHYGLMPEPFFRDPDTFFANL